MLLWKKKMFACYRLTKIFFYYWDSIYVNFRNVLFEEKVFVLLKSLSNETRLLLLIKYWEKFMYFFYWYYYKFFDWLADWNNFILLRRYLCRRKNFVWLKITCSTEKTVWLKNVFTTNTTVWKFRKFFVLTTTYFFYWI